MPTGRIPALFAALFLFTLFGWATSLYLHSPKNVPVSSSPDMPITISVMGRVAELGESVEQKAFRDFSSHTGVSVRFSQSLQTINERIELFLNLLNAHSPEPDLIDMDVIWPAMLGNHLLDLSAYFQNEIQAYPPELLRNFVVNGRLVALPTFVDAGVLYYRPDLLKRYGYSGPPQTWEEMERMAMRIQTGERRAGNTGFWGYVWQGGAYESLTCNALEWQASSGGGEILGFDRTVQVRRPGFRHALERAIRWVGTISPPGTPAFGEPDSLNFWNSGNAAFMRNWTGEFHRIVHSNSAVRDQTAIAALPGGVGGSRGTLGGSGLGISKYSAHPQQAIAALKIVVSEATQRERAIRGGYIPTRTALQNAPDIMAHTPLHGAVAGQVIRNIVARPALQSGSLYSRVSHAYFTAIHDALARKITADQALLEIERKLVEITGDRALPASQ